MEVCKICGKEFKKITMSHIRTHDITKRPVYDKLPAYGSSSEIDDSFEELDVNESEILESNSTEDVLEESFEEENIEDSTDKLTLKQQRENIFSGSSATYDPNRPIQDFLDEFGVTELELRNVIKKFKGTNSVPISQQIENKIKLGEKSAAELANSGQRQIKTKLVATAESLVKNHGYEVLAVVGGPPKTWVLEKII